MRAIALRIVAFALCSAFVLSACAGSSNAPILSTNHPALVVDRVKDAVILDPAQATDGMSLNVTTEVMKGLVQFKLGTFSVEPAIAQSWTMSPDGRTWTFVLKKGLTFSDGTPIDAKAVQFNFDRWRLLSNPYHGNFEYPYYQSQFGGFPGLIADVRAPQSDVVVFRLSRPFTPFLHTLALPAFAIGSPTAIRSDLAGFAVHPVGWGPYTLVEWVKGNRIVLRANHTYPVNPTYDTVIIRDVDQATGLQAMQSGDADILTDPRPEDTAVLARTPGVTVYYQPGNNNAYLAMNLDRRPFGKLAVRQAIAYAVDVRSIVKTFFPSGADVADNWTPPGMLGENTSIKAYPYDLRRARALMAAAGYRRGFTTELFYPTIPRPYMPEPQRVAEAIKQQLRRIGITVQLQGFDWKIFLQKIHNGEHAMCLAGWSGDNGDPDNFLYALLDRDSARRPNALNYSFWRDERFHQLMLQGQMSEDPAMRAQIYQEANAMVHDVVPSIPIVHVAVPIALRTSIAGFIPGPDTRIAFEYLHPRG